MTQHKMKKRVICPIMSYRDQHGNFAQDCTHTCGFWDEENQQCCIKTLAQIQNKQQRIENYVGGFGD